MVTRLKSQEAPLTGIRVVDLSWVMVGPVSSRYLADLGAEVIKVESSTRIDPLRRMGPYRSAPTLTNSLSYQFLNAGKSSIAINLQSDRGRAVLHELIMTADVVVESFTPGVMDRLGMSAAQLCKDNPRLIYLATSLFGSSGPLSKTSGVGTTGAAFSGAGYLVGWPDRNPTGPFHAWTDAVTPRYNVSAVLGALYRREQTGRGCQIDVSQAEAGLQFVVPSYLDYAVNGAIPERRGSALSNTRAPSGTYPCAGDDRWVAIDVATHHQWSRLAEILGSDAQIDEYSTLVGRLRARPRLDDAVAQWSEQHTDVEAETILQAAGIPAHAVSHGVDLLTDADLNADGYYHAQHSESIGDYSVRGAQFDIEPAAPARPTPADATGESTARILRDVLGYAQEDIDTLVEAGVLV